MNQPLVNRIIETIEKNPSIQNKINSNATMAEYWRVLQSGNQKEGEALADRILQSYCLTREEGIRQASQGLAQMFGAGGR